MAPVFFYTLLIYVLYKFVAGFIIPVYRTSKQFRQQVRHMQSHTQDEMNARARETGSSANTGTTHPHQPTGEYIEFEEIK